MIEGVKKKLEGLGWFHLEKTKGPTIGRCQVYEGVAWRRW